MDQLSRALDHGTSGARIEVSVVDQVSALSEILQLCMSWYCSLESASPNQERLIVSQCDEIVQEGGAQSPTFSDMVLGSLQPFSVISIRSVSRRYALENRMCKEGIVPRSTLKHREKCWLSDGVRGFFQGVINLRPSTAK